MENPDDHVFFSKCLLMRNDRILQYCIITFFQLINDRSPVSTDVSRAYFAAWPKAQSTVVSASFAPHGTFSIRHLLYMYPTPCSLSLHLVPKP
jgi:hypothetical protein